jgi:biotin transport system substrate-specific component
MQSGVAKTMDGLAHWGLRVSVREVLGVVGFALLLIVAANLRFYVPGNPVPVTMQTAAVLLCGFFLRPRLAMSAVVLYLAAGHVAASVAPGTSFFAAFQAGKSTATLGYLVGFVPAAGLVSALSGRVRRVTFARALSIGVFGMAVVFLFGVAWMALLMGSLDTAIQLGLVPFMPWTGAKVAFVASLVAAWGLGRGE